MGDIKNSSGLKYLRWHKKRFRSKVSWVTYVGILVDEHTSRPAYPNSHICTHCCYLMNTIVSDNFCLFCFDFCWKLPTWGLNIEGGMASRKLQRKLCPLPDSSPLAPPPWCWRMSDRSILPLSDYLLMIFWIITHILPRHLSIIFSGRSLHAAHKSKVLCIFR